MTDGWRFTIVDPLHPGRPPMTMNQAGGSHWRKVRAAKHRVAWQVREQLGHNPPRYRTPVQVAIHQYAPDNRRRDVDGLGLLRKHILDSLVDLGVLEDDSTRHVADGGNQITTDRLHPRITVTITELETTT